MALLCTGLASYAGRARAALSTATELDYGEGTVLWQIGNLPHLQNAVHSLNAYPYILFNYTPVYHCATRLIALFTPDLVTAGRLVSIFSMLGICLLAGLIVRRSGSGWASLPCSLVAALLLFQLPNADWSLLVRVDTIGIFFTYLGLFLFLSPEERGWRTYAAFASFTLAIYSRQTMIAAPAACLLILWVRDRRLATRVFAAFAATGLIILLILSALTHGEFPRHLFTYNVSPFHWRHGIWLALALCRRSLVAILPALAWTAGWVWRRIHGRTPLRSPLAWLRSPLAMLRAALAEGGRARAGAVILMYLAIGAGASLSIAKVGANVNYLLEPLFACCILAAFWLEEQLETASPRLTAALVLAPLAVAMVVGIPAGSAAVHATGLAEVSPAREAAHGEMLRRLQVIPGDVYSEEMSLLTQAGKQVPGEPASVTFLSAMHLWSEKPLVERFQNRAFAAVVVNTSLENPEHFSPEVRAAVQARYELREEIGTYRIYLPR